MPVLKVDNIRVAYGKVPIINGISLDVHEAEIVGVLGQNGMGKTTLLKALMGVLPISDGSVWLSDRNITKRSTFRRARQGLAYVPQGRGIFPSLSVEENLRFPQAAQGVGERADVEVILGIFPRLRTLLGRQGRSLSGGEQQLLALARALITRPKILLLDEPTEGIQPSIIDEIIQELRKLRENSNIGILLVEQNMHFIKELADRVLLLQKGLIVKEIAPALLNEDFALSGFK